MTHVLLVEDDVLLARQFVQSLEREGYTAWHARHAGEALALIEQRLPDVIILDMLLPVTSGVSFLHELRSYGDTAPIPVVVCTSMADSMELEALAPYGVRRLVDKTTMSAADLTAAVRAMA